MQFGFVVGALCSAALGLADRFDPRRVFCTSAIAAALVNAALLAAPPGGLVAIAARIATGALHVGVYPVGMKIAVGWGVNDRGFLVGAFVGAFTLGSASLHLLAFIGRVDWRVSVAAASMIAGAGGFIALTSALGPHHALAQHFDPRAVSEVWTNRRVWLTNAGYLGHMWELYAMWAWIAAATAVSYGMSLPPSQTERWPSSPPFSRLPPACRRPRPRPSPCWRAAPARF